MRRRGAGGRRRRAGTSVEAARRAYDAGDRARAARLLQGALLETPDDTRVLGFAAMLAFAEADLERAAIFAERLRARAPEDPEGHLWAGRVALAREDPSAARAAFEAMERVDPMSPDAPMLLAEAATACGDHARAYAIYRNLVDSGRATRLTLSRITGALDRVVLEAASPAAMERDVMRLLGRDDVDHDEIARPASRLLAHRYARSDGDPLPDPARLAGDPLLLATLERVFVVDPALERMLVETRRELLVACLERLEIPDAWMPLVAALGEHGLNCEHVHAYGDVESEMVAALDALVVQLTAAPDWSVGAVAPALMLAAMYRPVHELAAASAIATRGPAHWQAPARSIVERGLFEVASERARAARIPAIAGISGAVSEDVRAQYEANPYPRWRSLVRSDPVPYWLAVRNELPGFRPPPALIRTPTRVLVAGCGTGREALSIASTRAGVEILAVDLSRRSLAYGARMAERRGISNVEFRHADILDLGDLERRFDVIVCSGVLHHMREPAAGLAVLRALLAPGGMLKLGLYSEVARRHVVHARALIARLGLGTSAADVRRFRAALVEECRDPLLAKVFETRDFFSTSGCRDLLFHVQEHRFDTTGLRRLLDGADLEFLGFTGVPAAAAAYRRRFRDDAPAASLERWGAIEAVYPDSFRRMYKLWCRPREDVRASLGESRSSP